MPLKTYGAPVKVLYKRFVSPMGVLCVVLGFCSACSSSGSRAALPSAGRPLYTPPAVEQIPAIVKAIGAAASNDTAVTGVIDQRGRLRIGCGAQVLGRRKTRFYAWILCIASHDGGNISVPAVATAVRSAGKWRVVELSLPDPGAYSATVRKLFPRSLVPRIEQEVAINFQDLRKQAASALGH